MTLRIEARPSGILVPITDFGLRDLPTRPLILGEDIALVAALNLGTDGREARLLKVDANGNLRVVSSAQGDVNLAQINGVTAFREGINGDGVAVVGTNALEVAAIMKLVNTGSTVDRARSASAANLNAQSGLGVAMVAPPGNWTASSNPAAGTAASASRVAGGAGVRHVGTGAIIVLSATTALAGITTVTFNFRDGASGAGTILFAVQVTLPAAVIPQFQIVVPPISLPGTAATAMTLEGSAAVGNLMESCTLFGYDAS